MIHLNNIYNKDLIDRFDPFNNPTENREFNSDYRTIVPQVSIDGCKIPDFPSAMEKKRIRHFYNMSGLMIIIHTVLSVLLAIILSTAFQLSLYAVDENLYKVLPFNYDSIVTDYLSSSSIMMGVNLLAYLISNLFVFFLGCKICKIPINSMFQTKDLSKPTMLRYMGIGLFLQMTSAIIIGIITTIIEQFGGTASTPDFEFRGNTKLLVVTILYTCIVAPITEELVFRGFLLKNMSRVSQKFGIVITAVMFGIFHGNIPQAILAFITGIFLAHITIKHNSILPAIAVHATVNTFSMINTIGYEYLSEGLANLVFGGLVLLIIFGGLALFIYSIATKKGSIPKTTRAQRKRGASLAFSSWVFIIAFSIYAIITLVSVL